MPISPNRSYLPEVDHLRAFAALLVLSYHGLQMIGAQLAYGVNFSASEHWLYPSNPIIAIVEEGHTGVGLFIVLSGFILSLGTVGNKIDYKSFLIARILRIYPLLLVYLILANSIQPSSLLSFLATLLPFNTAGGVDTDFTAMYWAVAIEFQCYLVFPFLIAFSDARGSKFLLQVIMVALVLRLLAVFAAGANPRDISYWTVIGRIDQFCLGIIAARLYVSKYAVGLNATWFLLSAATAAGILVLFNRAGGWPSATGLKMAWPTIEGVMWAGFIVTYLAAGRRLPPFLGRFGAKLGEISYSTYLVHYAVIVAIIKHAWYVRATGNGYYDALVTTFLVALPMTVAIAGLTYHTIELPFLQLRPRYVARNADPRPPL